MPTAKITGWTTVVSLRSSGSADVIAPGRTDISLKCRSQQHWSEHGSLDFIPELVGGNLSGLQTSRGSATARRAMQL